MRTIAIGDIHGADRCLEELLTKVGEYDRVIFLGDYVDGWPETPQVLDRIIALGDKAICLRGNHDQWALEWMNRCLVNRKWNLQPDHIHYSQGGKATYDAYMAIEDVGERAKKMVEHLMLLERMNGFFIDEESRLFVHGGMGIRGIHHTDAHSMMWDRELVGAAYRLRDAEYLPSPYDMYKEIYVGHCSTRYLTGNERAENWLNLWDLDSNCGYGGPLTAIDVDTKDLYTSTLARDLYPEYEGR